jgi:hypothetical protein
MTTTQLILIIILSGLILGLILHIFDIHIAIYRPKAPGRTTYFYTEVGNPTSSALNIPPKSE